jgi:hypothetical protein
LSGGNTFAGGTGNSFAIAPDGTLYLAFFNTTTGHLDSAIRNASGVWGPTTEIDNSSSQVGLYVSMALDSTGKPGVAYFESSASDLKYAHYNGSSWDPPVVCVGSKGTRGYYPSLVYQSDKPTISHYAKTGSNTGSLMIDQAPTVNPSASTNFSTVTIDATSDTGRYSCLVYNPSTSKWGISYDEAGTAKGARYIQSTGSSVTGTWGAPETVPQISGGNPSDAVWTSLVYDASNRAAFAWYDNVNIGVNFSHRNGSGSTPWNSILVDGHGTTGKYPNLSFESNQFRVSYYNQFLNAVNVKKGGDTGGGWIADADLVSGAGSELKVVRRNGVTTFAWSDGDLHINDDQTGVGWTRQSNSTGGARRAASSAVFNGKMWQIGGLMGANPVNSVVYSGDGLNWSTARANLDANGFSPRDSQASAVFNGQMWVIGGETSTFASGTLGDAWSSSDGTNWTQAMSGTNAVDLGPRRSATAVTFNNNLYVIGGISNDGSTYPTYPVEYSSDGVNWNGVTVTAFQRYGLTALVYGGAIYVIGGLGADTDTYSSTNGTSWTDLGAPNVSFLGAVGLVFDNKMWMIDGNGANWSTDGVHWTRAPLDPDGVTPFDGRTGMTGVVLPLNGADKMWVLGGYVNQGQIWRDDAWYSS